MLKIVLAVVAALVLVFVIIVATRPSEFRIARTATIAAAPTAVSAHVDDFHKWQAWSPWARLDPAATATYSGPDSGAGAAFAWKGNDQIGEGNMTVLESKPGELVRIALVFIKPYAGTSTAEFTFKPSGTGTEITWSMSGTNGFVGKAICMFMDMDKTVGGEFEKGLANLKGVVEAAPAK